MASRRRMTSSNRASERSTASRCCSVVAAVRVRCAASMNVAVIRAVTTVRKPMATIITIPATVRPSGVTGVTSP